MWTVPVDQVSYWLLKSLMDRICLSVLHLRELNLFADGRRLNSRHTRVWAVCSDLLSPADAVAAADVSRQGAVDSRSRTGDPQQSPLVRCRAGSKPENPTLRQLWVYGSPLGGRRRSVLQVVPPQYWKGVSAGPFSPVLWSSRWGSQRCVSPGTCPSQGIDHLKLSLRGPVKVWSSLFCTFTSLGTKTHFQTKVWTCILDVLTTVLW